MVTPALAPKRSAGASVRTGGQTYYLFPYHPSASSGQALDGTHITANSSGTELGKLLYQPWGETRISTGKTPTASHGASQDSGKMVQSGCTFTTRVTTTLILTGGSSPTPLYPTRAIRRAIHE